MNRSQSPPIEQPEIDLDFDVASESADDKKYDTAMRRWVERHLPEVVGWLDPTVADLAPSAYTRQVATFALPTISADLLTTAGKNRLVHIEYETSPRKSLITRMFNYRARIMTLYPRRRLTQHVIVLGNGRVHGHDDESNGFILHLHVVYLRERDPDDYLRNPVLAPLAVLTKGRRAKRERSFAAALRLIQDSGLPGADELLMTAETLAHIRLDPTTIDRVRKENGMSIQPLVDHYRNTEVGHHLQRIGRESMLRAAVLSRFGEIPEVPAIVSRLSSWTEIEAMSAIVSAPDPGTLLKVEPQH